MLLLALLVLLVSNVVHCHHNPLEGKTLYVNPMYTKNVDGTIANLSPGVPDFDKMLKNLQIARNSPTACWLNSVEQVQPNNTDSQSMNGILLDASKKPGTAVVFIVNNIPRGNCLEKLASYKNAFVKNMVATMNIYKSSVTMAFVVEPDAVGQLVTDIANPVCEDADTQKSTWKQAAAFAVSELNLNAPDFPIYLGLGHSNWLGTDEKSKSAAEIVTSWDVVSIIRGFATNISNYKPVGKACPEANYCQPGKNHELDECCLSSCDPKTVYTDNSEMNFALRMEAFFPGKKFVIDTGRNGVSNARTNCTNWCNPRNIGLGMLPTADTLSPLVDAYLWIKPPGETSGCTEILPTGATCKSFTPSCKSVDSVGTLFGEPRMPEVGHWSDYVMIMLARNANFGNVVLPYKYATNTSATPAVFSPPSPSYLIPTFYPI